MALNAEVILNYALPTTVQSIRDGWLATFQSAATVSGLLAGVTAQLLVFFKTNGTFVSADDPTQEPVLTLTYIALILSIGATISSLILTDELSDVPVRAARSRSALESSETQKKVTFLGHDWGLLRFFGLRRSTRFVTVHLFAQQPPLLSMSLDKKPEGQ